MITDITNSRRKLLKKRAFTEAKITQRIIENKILLKRQGKCSHTIVDNLEKELDQKKIF